MDKYTDEKTIARIVTANNSLDDTFQDFFTEVSDNKEFIKGRIYTEADKKRLKKKNRPAFETRLFRPILNQIYGSFMNHFPGIDFLGMTETDHQKAEVFKNMNDYIMHQANNTRYEMSKALLNSMIGRIGWVKQEFSFGKDKLGMVEIRNYNKQLKFDPTTTRRDLSDCNYISDEAYLSTDDLISTYANNKPDLEQLIRQRVEETDGGDKKTWINKIAESAEQFFSTKALRHSSWEKNGKFLVIDWYERKMERTLTVYDRVKGIGVDVTKQVKAEGQDGELWYSKEKLELITSKMIDPFIEEGSKSVIHQTSICPALDIKLYEAPQQLGNGNFKFTPILGYDFSTEIIDTQSVVDDIKDLIKSWNMRDNTNLTLLMKSAHGGYLVEEGAKKKGIENLENNDIGSITLVPNGTLNKILPKALPQMSPSIAQYQQSQLEMVKFVSSSTDNARGLAENAQESGKLFNARVSQSNITQEGLNDNAQWVVEQITQNNIWFIQNLMSQERIVRVVADDGDPEFIAVNTKNAIGEIQNDLSVGNYDVKITSQPIGKSGLDEERTNLIEIVNAISQIGEDALPTIKILLREIIKKTAISNKQEIIREFVPEVDEQQQAQQQALAQQQEEINQTLTQLEMANKTLTNEELASKIEEIKAKTAKVIEEAKQISRDFDNEIAHAKLDGLLTELQGGDYAG